MPRPSRPSSGRRYFISAALLLIGVAAAIVLWQTGVLFGSAPFSGPTWTVRKDKLKITIVARGNLESAKNGDIVCTVRSGTKGSTNATTIKWLIENGSDVKKGEKVIELDDSGLVEQLKAQKITVDQANAAWVTSDEQYRIQEIDNENEIEKAKNALDLAEIDLEKYVKGEFIQFLKDVEGRIETAKSNLDSWVDRAAWSARMVKKGLMSKVQADADESRMSGARFDLQKVEEEKRVLVDFMKKRTEQDLSAKLAEAKRGVEKAKGQAKAKLAQAEADRLAKRSVYEQEMTKKREVEVEIGKCIVLAPQDGLVVYYVPEQMRGGGAGSQQSIIAQGEPVREGQKLMQIPDLARMLVSVRVPEAMVSHLHSEDGAEDSSAWQAAQIKLDAFSSRVLRGHVRTVDTVASQQDWFAADVKVYRTMVAIDTPQEGLKPGMSAEVTIFAEESPEPVLVVPVQAVLGTISMGADRKCFVVGGDGQPALRDITVGMSNERLVEVKPWDEVTRTGLKEGEKVVLNPRPLLKDNSDMKPGKVRGKNEEESEGGSEGGKKDGKKKGADKDFATKKFGKDAAGKDAAGNDAAGKDGADKAGGGAAGQAQVQAFMEKLRNSTPVQRRDMINAIPEAAREKTRQWLKNQSLEVAD